MIIAYFMCAMWMFGFCEGLETRTKAYGFAGVLLNLILGLLWPMVLLVGLYVKVKR